MIFWISAAYLFLPYKVIAIQLIIPFFYFWAGILKLTPEWLSGSSLYSKLWLLEGKYISIACYYVVFLELFFIWGIFSKRLWVRILTLAQLILFHTFSFSIVGFFYPTLMYSMLLIYPLAWYYEHGVVFPSSLFSLKLNTIMFIVFFSFTQILPKFFGRDTSLTGEGRLFALHMFDAKIACESNAVFKRFDGQIQKINLKSPLSPRLECDPAVFLSRARSLCKTRNDPKHRKLFDDFDWTLRSRHSNETEYKTVVEINNFCEQNVQYSIFKKNKWIALDS